jgi:hypothetical protein
VIQTTAGHRLLFSPDTLRGDPYEYLAIKARVEGIALSDVYMNWQFPGTLGHQQHNHIVAAQPITDISYPARGRYTILASVYDVFSDSIVARDSTVALIDSFAKSVSLSPGSIDTGVFQFPDGTVDNPFDLSVSTSANTDFFTYDFHISGMGIDTAIHTNGPLLSFAFPLLGAYHISVTVSDIDGRIYGSDSAVYNLKMKSVDPLYFIRMKSAGSVMKFEQSSSASVKLEGISFLLNSLIVANDSLDGAIFSQHSFTLYSIPPKGKRLILSHDSLVANFSGDFSTITSFTVFAHDTNGSQYGNYSVTVGDAKLIAITRTLYLYAITGLPSAVFVRDIWGSYNTNISQFQETQDPFDFLTSFAPHLIDVSKVSPAALYIILHQ